MTIQLAVRLWERTLQRLDRLIRAGRFATRTEALRVAVDTLVADSERREAEAAIVEGYRRVPDSPTDAWLDAATEAMVSAEPW
jgi:Arc/MetJ-type ribon-helix-helix transcriptional regulator